MYKVSNKKKSTVLPTVLLGVQKNHLKTTANSTVVEQLCAVDPTEQRYKKREHKKKANSGHAWSYTLPKVSFSPESGGRVKPNRAMLEIKTQGTMRLKK